MSYIVLARKWRPQKFEDLVGQQHIAQTLRNAIRQDRVAHAFLFTGSRGVGKTSTARIFAKALNCEHAPCDEPCNVCRNCVEITEGRSMDVIEIDGASNRGINEIREVLEAVRYAPTTGRYKIYIIDEVHMLTTEAFNALLKTLEEPPPHVVFIFATTDPNKIPITIVSRCQRYDFKRISLDDLVAHLGRIASEEQIAFEESALRLIARTARGGVRDALSAMDQIIAFAEQPISGERAAEVLGVASRETLMRMAECVIKKDVAGALACIDKVDHYGQNLSQFGFDLLEFWRDVTVLAAVKGGNAPVELNAVECDAVRAWLPLVSFDVLQRVFQIWYQTTEALPKSLSPRLVMEMATVRMCQVEHVVPLDGILRKLDDVTRAVTAGTGIAPDALSHVQEYLKGQGLSLPDEKKKPLTGEGAGGVSGKNDGDAPRVTDPANAVSDARNVTSRAEVPYVAPKAPDAPARPNFNAPAAAPARPNFNAPDAPARPNFNAPAAAPARPNFNAPAPAAHVPAPETELQEPDYFDDMPWPEDADASVSLEDMLDAPGEWTVAGDDEEDEDEETGNAPAGKKMLAVSREQPKSAPPAAGSARAEVDPNQRWKRVVMRLREPISTIMSRARLNSFSPSSVDVTLSQSYRDMLTAKHIQDVERILDAEVGHGCRLHVMYSDIGDDSDTLDAERVREAMRKQEDAFARVLAQPVMRKVMEVFHVDPDGIRLTFNPDRTSK
ncbi:MAG: DNA polymerase III subunit gamma/tau [Proteobacteria bacterium]|nr:DNA polymerase III subunit gamma/tau [Pseudomonadota bacterium]